MLLYLQHYFKNQQFLTSKIIIFQNVPYLRKCHFRFQKKALFPRGEDRNEEVGSFGCNEIEVVIHEL